MMGKGMNVYYLTLYSGSLFKLHRYFVVTLNSSSLVWACFRDG